MAEITIGVSGRGNGKEYAICKTIAEVANKLGATKESPLRVAVQRNEVQKENLEKLFQQMGDIPGGQRQAIQGNGFHTKLFF